MSKKVIPTSESFFNDGYWYILGSSSLGESKITPNAMEKILNSKYPHYIKDLLDKG